MTEQIKAIQTAYDGYMFRSRLEARWAVFFNTLRIEYVYEREGYTVPSDADYLCDFWLPKQELWVEIKGEVPTAYECGLCEELSQQGNKVCIVWGNIGNHRAYGWQYFDGIYIHGTAAWFHCRNCDAYDMRIRPEGTYYGPGVCDSVGLCRCDYDHRVVDDQNIHNALIAARSARFEHDARQPGIVFKHTDD